MQRKIPEEYVGEDVDKLITIDVGSRGIVHDLYKAARGLIKKPLAMLAAQRILEKVKGGENVFIFTGFRIPPKYIQETDGPLGAASLARFFIKALKLKPTIFIERESANILLRVLNSVGLVVKGFREKAMILDYPMDFNEAVNAAESLLDNYEPSLVVAIEKAGSNVKGVYHNMRGLDISKYHIKVEPILELARKRNILTIGIGDGGNEVGMGNIVDVVRKRVPYGEVCRCPCKAGIAATSRVDALVVSSVSNWGGYGIEACLAYLTGKRKYMHKPLHEKAMLKAAIEAGAIDGVTGKPSLSVDGIGYSVHRSIVEVLNRLIA